jgi:hypothetical protein
MRGQHLKCLGYIYGPIYIFCSYLFIQLEIVQFIVMTNVTQNTYHSCKIFLIILYLWVNGYSPLKIIFHLCMVIDSTNNRCTYKLACGSYLMLH